MRAPTKNQKTTNSQIPGIKKPVTVDWLLKLERETRFAARNKETTPTLASVFPVYSRHKKTIHSGLAFETGAGNEIRSS